MTTARNQWLLPAGFAFAVASCAALVATAQTVPPPVISIGLTNTNRLAITVTNGVAYANYSLYTTPILNNSSYPWTLVTNAVPGVTNFVINQGPYVYGFFLMTGGTNWNHGGVPNWDLADPNNPGLGALTVTIVSPTQGAIIQ
jgi:hypothetical protein